MTDLSMELMQCLKKLRMPCIAQNYQEAALRAQEESLSYEEYLYHLLQLEAQSRENNRIQRYLKESRLPLEKNLDGFEQSVLPHKVREQFKQLLKGHFLAHQENVLAFGNPGSGKTHLVCALAQELIKSGYRIYFASGSLFVQELLASKEKLKLASHIKRLAKFDAVILDDIGYVQQSQAEMEVLFTFLSERYEKGSVIITSNLPFSQWEKIFKNPVMTEAAIDRLIHHSVIVELNLPSYRMAQAQKKKTTK